MIKTVLLITYLILLARDQANSQKILTPYSTKKLVTVSATPDSAANENFCVCKIIAFSSENNMQRTDAIFAGSSPDRPVSRKQLLRNIDYELQQALVFFDSYRLMKQFASAVDCNALYKYLKKRQEVINRSTFLSSAYAYR